MPKISRKAIKKTIPVNYNLIINRIIYIIFIKYYKFNRINWY